MKLSIALAMPMFLILVGIFLLIGCLPIPATKQLQPNLHPRPEFAIGTWPGAPVRIGHTHIDDTFIEISRRIQIEKSTTWLGYAGPIGTWVPLTTFMKDWPGAIFDCWTVSGDGKTFIAQYDLRTGTVLWPTCAIDVTEKRYLVLSVDPNGVVVKCKTLNESYKSTFVKAPIDVWLKVFDEPTRHKLQNAGVFPNDAEIRRLEGRLPPTTQESP